MNIAVFDENVNHREQISLYIQDFCEKHMLIHQIFSFDTLSTLLCQALSGKFDLIFINITGTSFRYAQASHLFQKASLIPLIVFTLSESDLNAAMLHTHAFAFLLKPFIRSEFDRIFERCLNQLPPADHFITVKESRHMVRIPLHDILYTCNDNHYVCIHTKHRVVRTYMPFAQFWNLLSPFKEFILYCHNSVVNLLHITDISGGNILMENHEILPVSRGLLVQTRQAYSDYCRYHNNF